MANIKMNTEAPSDKSWYDALKSKKANSISDTLNSLPVNVSSEVGYENLLNGPVNKLQRARILKSRANPEFEKVIEEPSIEKSQTTLAKRGEATPNPIQVSRSSSTLQQIDQSVASGKPIIRLNRFESRATDDPTTGQLKPAKTRKFNNRIVIINISTSPYISLEIQGMPSEVEVNPETTWAVIKSPGRNGAFYNYIGSEDSITMEISWYSLHESREDVITKCKLLESWSKADGDFSSPPRLEIAWGSSGIFDLQKFNLQSARYKLSNFQNSYKKGNEVIDLKLLPNVATQTLVFKRISTANQRHEDIIASAKVKQFTK